MRKIILVILLFIIASLSLIFLKLKFSTSTSQSSTSVVTSFYPLAEFARAVGGSYIQVASIVSAGVEPHDYEPTPADNKLASQARLFVFNGAGLDPWAQKIEPNLRQQGIETVNITKAIVGDVNDPHIWLDPVLAQKEVALIRDALIKIDLPSKDIYTQNAENYIAKLEKLNQQYRQGLASCRIKEIVTSHEAFGYLSKRYNLTSLSITGLSPDEEPSARKIAQIAKIVKDHHIGYIFFETLVSPKIAQTIAKETGAKTLVFNPLEGLTPQEVEQGKNYISIMQDNLSNLRTALNCN